MSRSTVTWVYPAVGHSANESETDHGHPAHRGFQRAVGATSVAVPSVSVGPLDGTFVKPAVASWKYSPPESDVYILENPGSTYLAPAIRSKSPDATIIQLAADLEFFGLQSYAFHNDPPHLSLVRQGERRVNLMILKTLLDRYVDAVIAVSPLMKETISEIAPGSPVEIAQPYIQPQMIEQLDEATPALSGSHAVAVCESRDHKGIDMLVKAWKAVRDRVPGATLHVVGEGHSDRYNEIPGVTVKGYVDDLISELEAASLYVHPARADAFPVTVLEAMRGGIPPLITRTTVSKSLVSEISEKLIVEPDPKSLANGIVRYFDIDTSERSDFSKTARTAAAPFTQETKTREFKQSYDSLLKRV